MQSHLILGSVAVPNEGDFVVVGGKYPNGRLSVYLNQNQRMHLRVSMNVPDVQIDPDTILAKMIDVAEPYKEPLLACGLFEDTGKRLQGDFYALEIWRVKHAGVLNFLNPVTTV